MDFNPSKSSVHEERSYRIRLLGTGAANPVTEVGQGVVVTRTAVGVFKVTFNAHPGTFVNCNYMFGAATPSDVKGQTCTRGIPVITAGVFSMSFSTWSSAFAADELLATEYLDLTLTFAATLVP
jgi:hypothetical protein